MLPEAAEAAILILAFLSAPMAAGVITACEYGLWAVETPGMDWVLAATLASFALLAGATNSNGMGPPQTPYTLLGVTTTSSRNEITMAYLQYRQTAQRSVQLGVYAGDPQLAAYQEAHETLVDPLRRCVYHRDSEVPDWYGIPRLCWGERAIDSVQGAKRAVERWTGLDRSMSRLYGLVRKLKGLPGGPDSKDVTEIQQQLEGGEPPTRHDTVPRAGSAWPKLLAGAIALSLSAAALRSIMRCCDFDGLYFFLVLLLRPLCLPLILVDLLGIPLGRVFRMRRTYYRR